MTKSDFSRLCAENFAANGIEQFATDEILSKLCNLCEIFLETNKAMNLTAIKDEKLVISRHFAIASYPASFFLANKCSRRGSGGGMPALRSHSASRPQFTALDASRKDAYIEKPRVRWFIECSSSRPRGKLARTEMRASFDVVRARCRANNVLAELASVVKGRLFNRSQSNARTTRRTAARD
jgi:16S rRNA G527 N7-methylase RsmG